MTDSRETTSLRNAAVIGLGQMGRGIAQQSRPGGTPRRRLGYQCARRDAAGLSPPSRFAQPSAFGAASTVIFVVPGSAADPREFSAGQGGLLNRPHQQPGPHRPDDIASGSDARACRAGQGDRSRVRRLRHDRRRQGGRCGNAHADGRRRSRRRRCVPPDARRLSPVRSSISARSGPGMP